MSLLNEQLSSLKFLKDLAPFIIPTIGALIAVYNWHAMRRRAKLKDDLDILGRYRQELEKEISPLSAVTNNARYIAIRRKIDRRIDREYVFQGTDKRELFSGIALVVLAIAAFILPVNLTVRVAMAAILMVLGVILIYDGVKDTKKPPKNKQNAAPLTEVTNRND